MNLSRLVNAEDEGPTLRHAAPPPPEVPLPESPERSPSPAVNGEERAPTPQPDSSLSFIVICEAREGGKVTYISESVTDVVGFEPEQGIGRPAADFAHPDDVHQLYHAYQEMINEDKAACLLYLRIPHINPKIGHLLCTVTVSRVGRDLVGGVSLASTSIKAMYTASTAQEIYIIAPTAEQFQIRRWNDQGAPKAVTHPPPASKPPGARSRSSTLQFTPSPRSSEEPEPARSPSPSTVSSGSSSVPDTPALERLSLDDEPPSSVRCALILDRFSMHCPLLHITNADILPAGAAAIGRPFYDFVSPADEEKVRAAMDTVKGWGVNERGHPSDGGFGFYRFRITPKGRNSRAARPHEQRSRAGANAPGAHPYRDSRGQPSSHQTPETEPDATQAGPPSSRSRILTRTPSERGAAAGRRRDEVLVDAIFSPQSDGIIVILRRNPHSALASA